MKIINALFLLLFFFAAGMLSGQKKEFNRAIKDGYNKKFEHYARFSRAYTDEQIVDYCRAKGYHIAGMNYEENFIYGKSRQCIGEVWFTSTSSLAAKEEHIEQQRAIAAREQAIRRSSSSRQSDATTLGMAAIGVGVLLKVGWELFSSSAGSGGGSSPGFGSYAADNSSSLPCAKILEKPDYKECDIITQSIRVKCRDTDNITLYYWGPEYEKSCEMQVSGNTDKTGFYLKQPGYDSFLHSEEGEAIRIGCKCN
jgi:hypothetical protein